MIEKNPIMDFFGKFITKSFSLGHRALASTTQGGILSGVPILEEDLSRFFVQATVILGICRSLAFLGTYLRQPKVIFEIIGGIILGPSAMGRHKEFLEDIFPTETLPYLDLVAQIGLTLYLFLVGLELDPKLLKTHARKAGGIAIIGMAVPFALGVGISRVMFDVLQGDDPAFKDVDFVSFFVFIGTAMSITAFPVLARLLKEGGLIYTPAGAMAMGAAALNDAMAWCLLTLAISIANAGNVGTAGYVFLTVLGFALTLLFIIRPLFEYVVNYVEALHRPDMNSNLFVLTLCLLFMCAWTTALLGVHAIFGAFLFGLIIPRGSHLFQECNERIEELVVSLTLPLYFALSGLKTDVTTISTAKEGGITVLVCVVATLGKFIGAGGTALASGMTLRESSVVAVLMNTRGLVELIVLNLGVTSGILSVRTFSVMVVMCLFTTFITSPLIELIFPREMRARIAEKQSANESTESQNSEELDAKPVKMTVKSENYGRVAVIVDTVSKLQPLVNSLTFFTPHFVYDELTVTALHFIEPTNSSRDEFLALDERGRLIKIDEELTDISAAYRHQDDHQFKPPELLPLSVFCKAIHAPVNAFRIQGDPEEFSVELKSLCRCNDCDVVLLPFKTQSHYMQKFTWSSINSSELPIVLVMTKESHALASDFGDEVNSGRGRANSAMSARDEPHIKSRSNSIHEEHAEVLYTNVPDIVPRMRRGTITNAITKLPTGVRPCNIVAAVLLGEQMDLVILSMILRMAANKLNSVHLLLPHDYEAFPQSNVEAYHEFMKAIIEKQMKIEVKHLNAISTDYEAIYEESSEIPYDLILLSFVEPNEIITSQHQGRGRASTLSNISDALFTGSTRHVPDGDKWQINMPIKCLLSGLAYPELGKLGSLIQEGKHTKNSLVWVVHEPHRGHQKNASITSTVAASRASAPEGYGVVAQEVAEGKRDEEVGLQMTLVTDSDRL